jgi:ketosteroid isomerase-like protein
MVKPVPDSMHPFIMRQYLLSCAGCNVKHALWLCLLTLSLFARAVPCPAGQPRDEAVLVQMEHTWASALEHRDAAALACILADEFQDADPKGSIVDRAATLAKAAEHRPIHNELLEMNAHVYGDFGYIRGLATATDAQGKVLARVRFTDIYVYRDGRWQAVAAHESMLPAIP